MVEKVKVDVWGCCVCRDIIGIGEGGEKRYDVANFFEECSKIAAFSPHILADVSEEEQDDFLRITKQHSAFFRWYRADRNKTVVSALSGSGSGWLLVDFRTETYDLARIYDSRGNFELATFQAGKRLSEYFEAKGIRYDRVPASLVDFETWFAPFVEFCKERYGDRIVLVEARDSMGMMTVDGNVNDWPIPAGRSREHAKVLLGYKMNYEFKRRTGCHVIKCPPDIFSDECHKWGRSRVHYVKDYYDYGVRCLDIIMSGKDVEKRLDTAYLGICYEVMRVRCGEEISRGNMRSKIMNDLSAGDDGAAIRLAEKMAELGDDSGIESMAKHYLARKDNAGLARVRPLLRDRIGKGSAGLRPIYFDVVSRIDPDDGELLELAEEGLARGDPMLTAKYAGMLEKGRFVEQDTERALRLYQEALGKGYEPARRGLFELAWSLKGEHDDMLYDIIEPLEASKDPRFFFNLGRMLRTGRGVDKDPELAVTCFTEAAERGMPFGNIMAIDTLREIGDEDSCRKAFELSERLSSEGDMNARYRLGLAYEKGLGVPVDRERAAELYRESQSAVPRAGERLRRLGSGAQAGRRRPRP